MLAHQPIVLLCALVTATFAVDDDHNDGHAHEYSRHGEAGHLSEPQPLPFVVA